MICPLCLWGFFGDRVVDVILKVIMRAMWFAGGFHWMTVKGQQALPAEAPILTLAPHSSYFDAIPVTMTMASIVMKAESKDIPVWGSKCVSALVHVCFSAHSVCLIFLSCPQSSSF